MKVKLDNLHFEYSLVLKCNENVDLEVHDLQHNDEWEVEDRPININQAIENEINSWLEGLGFEVKLKLTNAWDGAKNIKNEIQLKKERE